MTPIPKPRRSCMLQKQHAVIHTTSIDVKIIRLDKRQVTLSVFRQLEEKSIFSNRMGEAPSLLGVPWGLVRYTWKGSPKWTDRYLVWQECDKIYRMPLVSDIDEWCYTFFNWMGLIDLLEEYHQPDPDPLYLSWYKQVCDHLETFEQLDQLFIAT